VPRAAVNWSPEIGHSLTAVPLRFLSLRRHTPPNRAGLRNRAAWAQQCLGRARRRHRLSRHIVTPGARRPLVRPSRCQSRGGARAGLLGCWGADLIGRRPAVPRAIDGLPGPPRRPTASRAGRKLGQSRRDAGLLIALCLRRVQTAVASRSRTWSATVGPGTMPHASTIPWK